jgi:glycerol uptake facilitator-like aquaporin
VGMCIIGAISWIRGALLVIAQLLGAMASAAVVSALFPGGLSVSTILSDGTSIARGLFIEMFLTAQLVFTIFMLAAEKHKATFIAPVGMWVASQYLLSSLTRVQRSLPVHRRAFWRVFHRWLPQSCEKLRPMRGASIVPRVPLDIL